MWWKRYEHILEAKPVTTREALIDALAKEQCEMLEAFPPQEHDIDWTDERMARKFRGRLHELPKVDAEMVDLVARIVGLDLSHEQEQIDWIFRNDAHREVCPTQAHVDALHLLWQTMMEVLLTRKDELSEHLKRKDLVEIVSRVPALYRRRRMIVQ